MSADPLRILCVHGVGHGEVDPQLPANWQTAIATAVSHWDATRTIELNFVAYDDLFAQAKLDAAMVAAALFKLGVSGLTAGLGDLFGRRRGLSDISEALRWTAGMVAQWADDERLRAAARQRVLDQVARFKPDVICAHSLGSLISYDAFVRPENQAALAGKFFVSFGSQIGNPFVRNTLGGRIQDLKRAKTWYHLFNRFDRAFTARIRLTGPNFSPVAADFDIAGFVDHDATSYLSHENTVNKVWREIVNAPQTRALEKTSRAFGKVLKKPTCRALLVGINDYPNPENRLEGCVNDVFLMSSVLQECGFDPEDIRVVLNERATAAGIRERLEWLLDGADAGDERVFYYSGHGAQIPGYGVEEKIDHYDECLVPVDFDWSRGNAVTDDQFFDLYSQLPYDTRFLTILDCCHSGGMTRDSGMRVRGLTPPDDIRHRMMKWNAKEEMWETRPLEPANEDAQKWEDKAGPGKVALVGESGATRRIGRAVPLRSLPDKEYNAVRTKLGHYGPYLPIILQACGEEEYSFEYRHGVISYGAFTYALAKGFRSNRSGKKPFTWTDLIKQTTETLHTLRYDQTPALVCADMFLNAPVPWKTSGART